MSAITITRLSPYNMTEDICFAKGDEIDGAACRLVVFDALVKAEVDAVSQARMMQVYTDASAATIASAATAFAWAYDHLMSAIDKHPRT